MNEEDFKKKDENLNKLLKIISEKEDKFWNNYWDDDNMANDLLDEAMLIINLQKGAIQNLIAKMKILQSETVMKE